MWGPARRAPGRYFNIFDFLPKINLVPRSINVTPIRERPLSMRQLPAKTALLLPYVFLVQCFLKRVYTGGDSTSRRGAWLCYDVTLARCMARSAHRACSLRRGRITVR